MAVALTAILSGCTATAGHPAGAAGSAVSGPSGSSVTTAGAPITSDQPAPDPAAATTTDAWTTYQADPQRLGVAPTQPPLAPLHLAWSAPLDGTAVYGQPLYASGLVLVATEGDDVYALDPRHGTVVWKDTIGVPLRHTASYAGCGDIDPLGVTSTPVVDRGAGVLYAVGEVSQGGVPPVSHVLVAIDVASGRILERVGVDPPLPPGESTIHLLQRAALALGNGRVYVGYGGQAGDCGRYHGWLVSVPVVGGPSGGSETAFDVTPDSTGGAIWEGGSGPAISTDGGVYVTTGNPNSGGPSPWAEAVVELPPLLGATPEAVFQDRAASGDLDLATGGPELLPDGTVFAAGKTEIGYRLRQSDLSPLGPVGGRVCASDPDGGAAYDGGLASLFLPCNRGGLQQIDLAAGRVGWRAGSVNSTPVLVDGALWALSYPAGHIEELDPATGRTLYRSQVGRKVPTFASLSAADGLLLVPTLTGAAAFAGPQGPA